MARVEHADLAGCILSAPPPPRRQVTREGHGRDIGKSPPTTNSRLTAVHEAASYQARRCNRAALSSTGMVKICCSMKLAKQRALALACRPVGEYGPEIDRRQRRPR